MTNETTGRRRKRKSDFVMIQNSMFEDNRLSWKAKGLLGYLLTKPDNWTVRVTDLVKHSTDGEKAVRSAIKELKTYGYLIFHRTKKKDGKWGGTVWEYDDVPMFEEEEEQTPKTQEPQGIEPCADFGHVDKGRAENRHAEKGTHISNTDFNNTDSSNTNLKNISSSRESIDSELILKYPNKPFEEIKEKLLNDPTAVTRTDKQYKAMLECRLREWKAKPTKQPNKRKQSNREEYIPDYIDLSNSPSSQDNKETMSKNHSVQFTHSEEQAKQAAKDKTTKEDIEEMLKKLREDK